MPAVLPQRSAVQCTQLKPHRFVRVYDIKTRALKSKTYLKQRLNTVLFAADGLARPTVRAISAHRGVHSIAVCAAAQPTDGPVPWHCERTLSTAHCQQ